MTVHVTSSHHPRVEYVEVFYNRERHQAVLGHVRPAEYYAAAKVA